MEHLGEQSVIDLVAGGLVGARAAPVHEHLDRCADCRALVAVVLRADATPPPDGPGAVDATAAVDAAGARGTPAGTPIGDRAAARDRAAALADARALGRLGAPVDAAMLGRPGGLAGGGPRVMPGLDLRAGLRAAPAVDAGVDPLMATIPTVMDGPGARRSASPADPAAFAPALPVARIDEYELIDLLGRGGMGAVYRAHDTLLDREVAIKLIARSASEAARQRFLVEARAVARIRHPNVVVVHRVGVIDEQPYIVYDLVRGRTFGALPRPLPWPKVLELATGALRGLAAAHACSVLHRDVKPANLMIDEHGDVVVVDFGLAKLAGAPVLAAVAPEAPGAAAVGPADPAGAAAAVRGAAEVALDPRMTATGMALGTPRYMAPETWTGADATPQTDLYSLGAVLYELLVGRPPFGELPLGEHPLEELGRRVRDEDAPPLAAQAPWVPPVLAAIVDRCLARDPGARPSSAAALGAELEALQRGRAFDVFERERVRRAPLGNPYPGARPFGFEHQGVFFGRTGELRALVDQLRERPLVVVAGEAGAGKTSLCMAGLLPILLRGALGGARKWVPVPVNLGARPMAALTAAIAEHVDLPPAEVARRLADDPEPVLAAFRAGHHGGCTAHVLYVDSLDDLAAGAAPPDEVRRFSALLARLAEPAPALRVLATLRAQNLLTVAQLPGLSAVIGPAIYLLLEPRDEQALRDIIIEPARLGGRDLAPPVVDSLLSAATRGELRLTDLAARLAALWGSP